MEFNTNNSLGRHGLAQMKRLEERDNLSDCQFFKIHMNALNCAEEVEHSDIMDALVSFLNYQAEVAPNV